MNIKFFQFFYNSVNSNSRFLSFLLMEFMTLSLSIVGPLKINFLILSKLLLLIPLYSISHVGGNFGS